VNASCRAAAPAGVSNAAVEAATGAAASRAPSPVRVWRYLTAVPGDQAPARLCAVRNASTAWAKVGDGSAPGALRGAVTVPSPNGLSQETRTGGASQTTPTAQVSGGAERGCLIRPSWLSEENSTTQRP